MSKIKVIFIAGAGRSGTTLLSRILGEVEGFFSAGELMWLWPAGYRRNQNCSCGTPLRDCTIWGEIYNSVLGEINENKLNEFSDLTLQINGRKNLIPLIVKSLRSKQYKLGLSKLKSNYSDIYKEISRLSGSRVIVDSSKDPSHALFLKEFDDLDVYTIHIVRDSRSVAFSRRRDKVKTSINWKQEKMPKQSFLKTSLKWMGNNVLNQLIADKNRYRRIRYEDLMRSPRQELMKIMQFLNEDDELKFVDGNVVMMNEHHTALGNPNKTQNGNIVLRLDDEWISKMQRADKKLVGLLTYPLLRKYGY